MCTKFKFEFSSHIGWRMCAGNRCKINKIRNVDFTWFPHQLALHHVVINVILQLVHGYSTYITSCRAYGTLLVSITLRALSTYQQTLNNNTTHEPRFIVIIVARTTWYYSKSTIFLSGTFRNGSFQSYLLNDKRIILVDLLWIAHTC